MLAPMSTIAAIIHLARLDGRRRRLLAEAAGSLTLASFALRLLPFRWAIRIGTIRLGPRQPDAEDCVAAIESVSRHLPWRTKCIQKGLAAQRMLRGRGVDAILRYGVRHHPESRELEAHVWVCVGNRTVIGGDEAAAFATVITSP